MEFILDHDAVMDVVESVWALLNQDNLFAYFVVIICAVLIWLIVKGMVKKNA